VGVMKILHVATRHRRGGAERNLIHTMQRELDRGWEVHAAVHPVEYQPTMPAQTRVHFVPQMVREVSPRRDLIAAWMLRQLVRREKFDVVHTHQSKAGILGRFAAWHSAPVIVHTIHMPSFGTAYASHTSWAFRRLERLCAHITDYFIAVGSELRDTYLQAGIGRPEQYSVIHSPINVSLFNELSDISQSQRSGWREALGIDMKARVILSIGALDPRKRHDVAMRQLASMMDDQNLLLMIAGEGPADADLRALATELGVQDHVRMLGFVEDVRPLFGIADALIHVSEVEGVPQVVLQALAAGVPVVASAVEGLSEIDNAPLLVVGRDCTGLGSALRTVLADPEPFRLPNTDLLRDWSPKHVDLKLQVLHTVIETLARRRSTNFETGQATGVRPATPSSNSLR
jgi:glycosyltransferase involved in cell wall biosynthesis